MRARRPLAPRNCGRKPTFAADFEQRGRATKTGTAIDVLAGNQHRAEATPRNGLTPAGAAAETCRVRQLAAGSGRKHHFCRRGRSIGGQVR